MFTETCCSKPGDNRSVYRSKSGFFRYPPAKPKLKPCRSLLWMAQNILYTVDGSEIRRLPVEVGSLVKKSHVLILHGFIHPRWFSLRISEASTVPLGLSWKKNPRLPLARAEALRH